MRHPVYTIYKTGNCKNRDKTLLKRYINYSSDVEYCVMPPPKKKQQKKKKTKNGKNPLVYVFTQTLLHVQDVTLDHLLFGTQLVWIQNFPSSRLVA